MIRTTVVGSWPLPEIYRDRLLQYHRGQLPAMLVTPTLKRIRDLLRLVEPERLWIAPSCGLGRRTTDIAVGKLSRMVEAAKQC